MTTLSLILAVFWLVVTIAGYAFAIKRGEPMVAIFFVVPSNFAVSHINPDLGENKWMTLALMGIMLVVMFFAFLVRRKKWRAKEAKIKAEADRIEDSLKQAIEPLFDELTKKPPFAGYVNGVSDARRCHAEWAENGWLGTEEDFRKEIVSRKGGPDELVLLVMTLEKTPREVVAQIPRSYYGFRVYVELNGGFQPL